MSKYLVIFTDWKILKRVLITLFFILLFRLGTLITVPGGDVTTTQNWDSGSFLGLVNMLGGGGLVAFSIFALGVTPYITASIIIQLLSSDVIPPLARLKRQGEKGRVKIEKITRATAIGIAILEGYAISIAMVSSGYVTVNGMISTNEWVNYTVFTLFFVTGSMISIWIADQITMKGIGNGTSMLIFVGIVAMLPTKILESYAWMVGDSVGTELFIGLMTFGLYIVFAFALILIMGFFEVSERKIPIQQTGKGLSLVEDEKTYLPVKTNPAGVIPVIFAAAIMTIPPIIAQFLPQESFAKYWIETYFSLNNPVGLSIYATLLVLFTFFYAHININAQETAENFQKSSTFIVGVKPGEDTEKYISKTITAMSVIGATVLVIISILPYLLTLWGLPESIAVGGTSLIIMVGVSIEVWDQLKARALASDSKARQGKKITKEEKKVILAEVNDTVLFN